MRSRLANRLSTGDGTPDYQDDDDDNDGCSDTQETDTGADPYDYDSDNDGQSDCVEIECGTNPTDPAETCTTVVTWQTPAESPAVMIPAGSNAIPCHAKAKPDHVSSYNLILNG